MGRDDQRGQLPRFEPGDEARAKLPGELVSDVNAAIEEHNWERRHSRRQFVTRTALAGVGASGVGGLLSACGDGEAGTTPGSASAAGGSGGPNRDGIRIVYPQEGGDVVQFFQSIATGAKQAGSDLGVTVEYRASGRAGGRIDLSAGQSRATAAAVATKPTGLMVGFWDVEAMADPIETAVRQGTTVVTLNATPDVDRPSLGAVAYVGQDELLAGQQSGERFKATGVRKVLLLNHDPAQINITNRVNGFEGGFGGPTVTVITPFEDPTTSANRIKAALASNADIDGVMSMSPPNASIAMKALEADGKTDIKVGTFDYTTDLLDGLAAGKLMFAVDQQQYLEGYYPVLIITMLRSLGFVPVRSFLTGPAFVTTRDVALIRRQIKSGVRSAD